MQKNLKGCKEKSIHYVANITNSAGSAFAQISEDVLRIFTAGKKSGYLSEIKDSNILDNTHKTPCHWSCKNQLF